MSSYADALKRYRSIGASKADDAAVMAGFCEHDIQILVGAVSPKLVWEGAQKSGLSSVDLLRLTTDPMAVADLMWVP